MEEVTVETPEVADPYVDIKVGDTPPLVALNNDIPVCSFTWYAADDNPDELSPWTCTRIPEHAPPHVAEGFSRVMAVHEDSR